MKRLPTCLLLAGAVLCYSAPAVSWGADVLTLEQAITAGLGDNQRLAAAAARVEALKQVPTRMAALPDPELKLNAMNLPVDTFATSQAPMTQLQVGIAQRFPYPGKRGLAATAAKRLADGAASDREEVRLEVTRNIRVAWWRLFYLDRALEIVGNNQNLLRQFVTITRTKYAVGRGLQQDVLLAQVELSKLLDTRLALEAQRGEAAALLNRWIGGPSAAAIVLPARMEVALPQVLSAPKLVQRAMHKRPLLAGAERQVEAAQARLSLAQKDHLPDLKVSALYGVRSGTNIDGSDRPDFASLMVSLNLPLHKASRQDRLVAQRRQERQNRDLLAEAAKDRVQAEIESAHARYQKAHQRVQLLEDGIIPQSVQTVASMQAGYQVNKVDFLNLVRAQINLFDFETRYWKSVATAQAALAQLQAAVGDDDLVAAQAAPPLIESTP